MQLADTLLQQQFSEDFQMISDGLMHPKSIMVVGGPPKSYKSFILNTIIAHLCTGTPLFGAKRKEGSQTRDAFRVQRPYTVALLEQEIGEYSYQERIKALIEGLPEDQQQLVRSRLWIHSCDRSVRLDRDQKDIEYLDALISKAKPDVLCLDPLVEFHGCDENSTQEMSKVMRTFDYLRDKHRCSLIVSHHCGKPNETRTGPDTLRGNSVIFGKGDAYLMLSVRNPNARIIKVDPTIRRGKPLTSFFVKLNDTNLRFEWDGWDTPATRKKHSKMETKELNDLVNYSEE